jgi:uncharacterized membrane protein YedE/YeeE
MLKEIHATKSLQLALGLIMGICFGFLLQKGGVTHYDVIMGQLLLRDWTVAKVMLSAIVTGMLGIYLLRIPGVVRLHKKKGSVGATVIGGLIFGVGFGLLGYCPGTVAGAVGQGAVDALLGGVVGMLIGTGLYSLFYDRLNRWVLHLGEFGDITVPDLLKIPTWWVILISVSLIGLFLLLLELTGF